MTTQRIAEIRASVNSMSRVCDSEVLLDECIDEIEAIHKALLDILPYLREVKGRLDGPAADKWNNALAAARKAIKQ